MSDVQVFFTIILIIWVGIGGYLLYLHLKMGKLEQEILNLSGRLESEKSKSEINIKKK